MSFIPWEELSLDPVSPPQSISCAQRWSSVGGLLMVALSSAVFSFSNLFVSILSTTAPGVISPFQIVFIRFLVQGVAGCLCILLLNRGRLCERQTWMGRPGNIPKLVLRGVSGTLSLSCFTLTISSMSLSDALSIIFLNIPLTAVFARILLGEEYTWFDAGTGLLGIFGVVLVAQPASLFGSAVGIAQRELSAANVGLGLLTAFLLSLTFLSIRRIGKDEDAFVVTVWFAGVGLVISPIFMAALGPWVNPPSLTIALLLLGVGVMGFCGQLLLNRGMALSPAGPASAMRYLDLVNALWMQSLLLGDVPNLLKWFGALLVLSTVFSVVQKSRKRTAPVAAPDAAPKTPALRSEEADLPLARTVEEGAPVKE